MFLHRQFIDAECLPTVGVDAFPVDLVSAAVLRFFPIHIAPKSLFLNEPRGQREHAVLSALEVPFVEDGEPVLKGHVGKTITVVVDALTEIKPVDSNHGLSTFAGVEGGGDIGIDLPPRGAENVSCDARGIGRLLRDDVDQAPNCLRAIERARGSFHDFNPLDKRCWDAIQAIDG